MNPLHFFDISCALESGRETGVQFRILVPLIPAQKPHIARGGAESTFSLGRPERFAHTALRSCPRLSPAVHQENGIKSPHNRRASAALGKIKAATGGTR